MSWTAWRRSRPFWGGLLIMAGGVEVVWTTWGGLGLVQFSGLAGATGWLVCVAALTAGVLAWWSPDRCVLPGVLALAIAFVSLVMANLGGLFLGFLLLSTGGAMTVTWAPGPYSEEERQRRGALGDRQVQ
ncbi:DUF6114 domain-containing protein [Streptomyces lanatus]|uniref:DUF6114 domain-containing protein n=1 Tax=Streptomyces lanatus TaxID=66900 RepID=A0ABV1XIR2_9ACTN|nr:DUF6114 domain-containing protein [Streptomyces lanatus]GHG92201.1 hypothetical protein GCM10018780_13550 [Streptomyces lanatus]